MWVSYVCFMNIKPSLFLCFVFASCQAFCQSDFREGFIISNSGDTLKGLINFSGDRKNCQQCTFLGQLEKEPRTFFPFDIRGYQFRDGKVYVSKYIFNNGVRQGIFAEYLVRGERKDLFSYRDQIGDQFLLSRDDSTVVAIPYKDITGEIDGKRYTKKSTKHIGFLIAYFSDCPEIFDEIREIHVPEKKSLIAITKEYHDKTCGENSCIIYKRSLLKPRLSFEPRLEVNRFSDYSEQTIFKGVLLNVWLPESNEKLFLRTGFLHSQVSGDGSFYKIPFQFQYVYAGKVFRPHFYAGLNIFGFRSEELGTGHTLTTAAGTGTLVRLTKSVDLDVSFELDLFYLSYDSPLFVNRTLGVGLLFSL